MKRPTHSKWLVGLLLCPFALLVSPTDGTTQGIDRKANAGAVAPASDRPVDKGPIERSAGKIENPATKAGAAIVVDLETLHLVHTYFGSPNGSRFFVVRLMVTNPTTRPITVKARDISLRVDGTEFKSRELQGALRNHTVAVGGKSFELQDLKPMSDVEVRPGKTADKWSVFTGLPSGVQVPAMVLRVTLAGKTLELNVNELARRRMGLTVDRIGPRGCLALLTISGELNGVSIGSLTSTLDALVAEKVVRAVIRFTEHAPRLSGPILTWLQQGAYLTGRGEINGQQMPLFPSALRELHLAALPNQSTMNLEGSTGPEPRIHKTDVEAIRAALKTAIEALPREELLAEIEKGHPLARPAALADGGARLNADDLPLVLKYADDPDSAMQIAALTALRHFGEPAAIEKLLAYARKNSEPTVSVAIESLAASRYADAHQALLNVLKNEHPASRRLIVRILAKYPRPLWSDTIYSFVGDSESDVAVEALRALVNVGHPRLFEVLKDSLNRGNPAVRDEAFQLLALRNDRQSEELALEFTLKAIKTEPVTPAMFGLLGRTKDSRAIPLLLAQLDRPTGSRAQLISTLAQIGDQSVADELARRYPEFPDREKTATLNALQQLKSSHFRRLAGEALAHRDTSLVNTAVMGLQNDGSPQAVQLLVKALETSNNSTVWSYITTALGYFGTPESKAALNRARDSDNRAKREMAIVALQNLRQRSPGYPYYLQAQQSASAERWEEAIANFRTAIELDPELPDAYSGRGHVLLNKKRVSEAKKDFSKAVELDPFSSEAITGLGICLVQEGNVKGGIKRIEDSRSRLKNDAIFTYNAGCVYGRALEHALKQPKSAERDKEAARFRARAIADLRRSVKLGFPQLDWMKKDPDLESLHDVPEFKKIVSSDGTDENNPPDDNSGDDNGGVEKAGGTKGKGSTSATRGGAATTDDAKTDFLFENARP